MGTTMTPVERLRAAEAVLRDAVANSRKMRESAPAHERAVYDFMTESMSKRGFQVIADIADEAIILAMAEVIGATAKRIEEIHDSLPFSTRLTTALLNVTAGAEMLTLADVLLGGGGA